LSARKDALRRAALRRRAGGAPVDVAEALASAVLPAAAGASRVAAYASFGTEPPTTCLLRALAAADVQVLLPVVMAGGDLDWASWHPELSAGDQRPAAPGGPRLGVDAVRACPLVVVPALAVDVHGNRLGRGGGSYDRALARLPPDVLTVALLYDGELVDSLPAEPHDVPVRAVVTPSGGLAHLSPPAQDGVVG
jgi:5-formyltetrahydrofolate cyclo-ligase